MMKDRFWEEVAAVYGLCGSTWCIAGDFNVARFIGEKLKSNRITRIMNEFDSLIRDLELKDPLILNGRYTWSNFREVPVRSRLDRFLFSQEWDTMFTNCRQLRRPRITSDHFPVYLDIGPVTRPLDLGMFG